MADGLDQHGTEGVTDHFYHLSPGVAVLGVDAHLDKFMIGEGLFQFVVNAGAQAGFSHDDDGLALMAQSAQITLLILR